MSAEQQIELIKKLLQEMIELRKQLEAMSDSELMAAVLGAKNDD